eukprot:gene3493-8301_t
MAMDDRQIARGPYHLPLVIKAIHACSGSTNPLRSVRRKTLIKYQAWTMFITFLTYMSYHMTRKSISVVKSTLNPQMEYNSHGDPITFGWAPFDAGDIGSDGYHTKGKANLGLLDTSFLFAYAVGMFFSGHVGDRSNLRYFLTLGMLGIALLSILLGMGFFWNIHQLWYFVFVQATMGIYQASGWPSVVSIMGRWFPRGRRGLLMGIWNAHTSIGNIIGSIIPAAVITNGWGWSFIVPGFIIAFLGILVFLTLVEFPEDLALPNPNEMETVVMVLDTNLLLCDIIQPESMLISVDQEKLQHKPIKFTEALCIPGVVSFALSLFFCKLVAYTFLYWLPFFIDHNYIGGKNLSSSQSAYLSTFFDVGGGTCAGYISDRTQRPAVVTVLFLILSVPMLFLYLEYGTISYGVSVALLLICGFFVNGPYALITTAVSADLGTHESLRGNPLALATVTAIIDGTGSIGAAIGPYLAGAIPRWSDTFYMLMGSLGIAAILLVPVLFRELSKKRHPDIFAINEI